MFRRGLVKKVAKPRVAKNYFPPEFPSSWKKFFASILKGSYGLSRIVKSCSAEGTAMHYAAKNVIIFSA